MGWLSLIPLLTIVSYDIIKYHTVSYRIIVTHNLATKNE
jgi:hypothetical protein